MGNISEVGEHPNAPFISAIDPSDKCTHPPKKEGETTFMDCPFDCIGVVISFMGSTKDILSLRNSCLMMFDFFNSQKIMSKVEFHYKSNSIDLKKRVEFIYRINIDALFVDRLRNKTFQYLPNLTHLTLRRTSSDHLISSSIFQFYPNLIQFRSINGRFIINDDFKDLSHHIEVLTITSLQTDGYSRPDDRKDTKLNSFTNILLERPKLRTIELWNFDFDEDRDISFFTNLNRLESLKVLSFRFSRFRHMKKNDKFCLSNLPSGLEELDVNSTEDGPNQISFPQNIRKLQISNRYTIDYLQNNTSISESVRYMDVSCRNFELLQNLLIDGKIMEKFPSVEELRMTKSFEIGNVVVEALMKFKRLRRVRVSFGGIRRYRYGGNDESISKYLKPVRGKQKVGSIEFVAY